MHVSMLFCNKHVCSSILQESIRAKAEKLWLCFSVILSPVYVETIVCRCILASQIGSCLWLLIGHGCTMAFFEDHYGPGYYPEFCAVSESPSKPANVDGAQSVDWNNALGHVFRMRYVGHSVFRHYAYDAPLNNAFARRVPLSPSELEDEYTLIQINRFRVTGSTREVVWTLGRVVRSAVRDRTFWLVLARDDDPWMLPSKEANSTCRGAEPREQSFV